MIRILHVVGVMNRAGTETWLMNVLRNIDRSMFHMDFLVHSDEIGEYDEEISSLGSKVIHCNPFRNPITYPLRLRKLLSGLTKYDVVHSHVHHFSGAVLTIARVAGVKVRLAHSHSDTFAQDDKAKFPRRMYFRLMARLIKENATCGLAASRIAAPSLFGKSWLESPKWQVLYCGIDFSKFDGDIDSRKIRADLGIEEKACVVGHVGRFVPVKNHEFLIEAFCYINKIDPSARLLLIGSGPQMNRTRAAVFARGLAESVIFAGARDDVPKLLRGAMDIFVFPSKNEGLGLSLVEAQAALLPCVASDVLTDEVAVSNVRRLSLGESTEKWAAEILRLSNNPPKTSREDLSLLRERFSIESSINALACIYASIGAREYE